MSIKFEGVKKSKSLGRLNDNSGIGVSTVINGEVTKVEYAKDLDGKIKKSASGNKYVNLNIKVVDEIKKDDGSIMNMPTFVNASYVETEYTPTLKDITPTEKLSKFVQLKINTGGEGKDDKPPIKSFKIRNYEGQDGSLKNTINLRFPNIQGAKKIDGTYTIKDFDDNPLVFTLDKRVNATVKGFIEHIKDTEDFINKNYNEKARTLKFNMYYLENDGDSKYDTIMPCMLENIDEDRVMDFIKFVKSVESEIIGVKGHVNKRAVYSETSKDTTNSAFGEYSYGGFDVAGYEAYLVVEFDSDKNNWIIAKTGNTGKLVTEEIVETIISEDEFPF